MKKPPTKSRFFREVEDYQTEGRPECYEESAEDRAIAKKLPHWERIDRIYKDMDWVNHIMLELEEEPEQADVTYKKGETKFFTSETRSSMPDYFIDHRVRCAPAPPYGNGCFALQDIPANTLIESAPVILCHQDLLKELTAIHGHTILNDYPFGWGRDGLMAIGMGYAGIYNHKAYPNVTWRPNYDVVSLEYRTNRDIEKDEQLFIRYLPLYKMDMLWFQDDESEEVADKWAQGKEDIGTMSSWKSFKPGNGKTGR